MNAAVAAMAELQAHPCAGRWQRQPYRETLLLPHGGSVLLRPAHHRDAPALQRFFAGMSPRSRLLRFHGALNRLPDSAARSMSTQVPERHVALLALDAASGEIHAEARYAVEAEGEAEFGIAVADAWQGRGLGRALLLRLAVHARESGITALRGSVLPGNEPMLKLMQSLGAEVRSSGAEIHGTIALTAITAPA